MLAHSFKTKAASDDKNGEDSPMGESLDPKQVPWSPISGVIVSISGHPSESHVPHEPLR